MVPMTPAHYVPGFLDSVGQVVRLPAMPFERDDLVRSANHYANYFYFGMSPHC